MASAEKRQILINLNGALLESDHIQPSHSVDKGNRVHYTITCLLKTFLLLWISSVDVLSYIQTGRGWDGVEISMARCAHAPLCTTLKVTFLVLETGNLLCTDIKSLRVVVRQHNLSVWSLYIYKYTTCFDLSHLQVYFSHVRNYLNVIFYIFIKRTYPVVFS